MKLVIFDFDGTLINSKPVIMKAYRQAILKVSPNLIQKIKNIKIGPTLDENINLVSKNKKIKNKIKKEFIKTYNKSLKDTLKFKYADKTLNLLSKKYKIFIVTNKRKSTTLKIIKYYKWKKYFTEILCSDSKKNLNNKKDLLFYLIAKYKSNNHIYIGDDLNDYKAANKNKMYFIRARYGYGNKDKWPKKDIYSIYTMKNLPNLINKIFV